LLLDQNLGAEGQTYDVAEWTRGLFGVEYACLAPQFVEHAGATRQASSQETNVLVSMGGADPKDATTTVLNAVFELEKSVNLIVTVGVLNPQRDEITELVKQNGGGKVVVDARHMAELMAGADIAVAAAGSTSWELARMGVPTLLTSVADNQLRIAAQLDDAGAAIDLGTIDDLSPDSLTRELNRLIGDHELRTRMSQRGQELVDGKGASRVVAEMLSIIQ
jgi:spore coat polysaccharide biosynthesis predicted glycosyltransferase SpsG